MSADVNVAIIGCGVIGPTHAEAFSRLEGVNRVVACDLEEAKAKKLAEEYGFARISTDVSEVFAAADVDAVSICTDHASHSALSIAALKAGKHVLCEKSLAASKEGLDAMLAAHESCPELVFSGIFQHRFEAINRILKRLVEEKAFGTLLTAGVQHRCLRTDAYYRADAWRGTWEQEGGSVLVNQAIHYVDLLGWIMGGVESLSGSHANFTHTDTIETEDTAVASLRFRNGALGTLEATCSSHLGWENKLFIHGSTGSIEINGMTPTKVEFEDAEQAERIRAELASCNEDAAAAEGKDYYGGGHPGQIADFVAAIREKRPPFVPAAEARHAVDIALAIYRSHKEGGWVAV
ncbi:MAG: Gfo/Idh/MocA family protein [Planctomycetota bacterium]|jgi:predicted dehydrogenase